MARYSFSYHGPGPGRDFYVTAKDRRALHRAVSERVLRLLPPALDACFTANIDYRVKIQNWFHNDVDLTLPAKPGMERYWTLKIDGCGTFRIGCQRTNRRTT